MCRASILANESEDAVPGVDYEISKTYHSAQNYLYGVLHRPGQGVIKDPGTKDQQAVYCAACIRGQETVTLTVPLAAQRELNLPATFVGTFISGDETIEGHNDGQDKVRWEARAKTFYLYDLADKGITLRLGDALAVPARARPSQAAAAGASMALELA